jgi:hypothetical protein
MASPSIAASRNACLRIKARRGSKKAIIAVAASMLSAAWHMSSAWIAAN